MIVEARKGQESREGFQLIRPDEEIEYEIECEEVQKSKLMRSKKYYAFEDKMSRNVINEVVFIENKHKDKFQDI